MKAPPAFDAASTVALFALLVTLAFRFVDGLAGPVREARAVVWDKTQWEKQRRQLRRGFWAAALASAVPSLAAGLLSTRVRLAIQALSDDQPQPRLVPALVVSIALLLVVFALANAAEIVRVVQVRQRWERERLARMVGND